MSMKVRDARSSRMTLGGAAFVLSGKRSQPDALVLEAVFPSIAEAAEKLGMNEAAVKMAISRLRQRLRDRLRETVAETLGPDDDLEAEMLHLRSLLSGSA